MSASKIFDVIFGAVVLGTVGVLTGLSMGGGFLPAALLIGYDIGRRCWVFWWQTIFFEHIRWHHFGWIARVEFRWG